MRWSGLRNCYEIAPCRCIGWGDGTYESCMVPTGVTSRITNKVARDLDPDHWSTSAARAEFAVPTAVSSLMLALA